MKILILKLHCCLIRGRRINPVLYLVRIFKGSVVGGEDKGKGKGG